MEIEKDTKKKIETLLRVTKYSKLERERERAMIDHVLTQHIKKIIWGNLDKSTDTFFSQVALIYNLSIWKLFKIFTLTQLTQQTY